MPMAIKAPPWSTEEEKRAHDELVCQLYPPKSPGNPNTVLRWVVAILVSLVIAGFIYGPRH